MPERMIRSGGHIVIATSWEDDVDRSRFRADRLQKRFRLASGRDPFTTPHTKTECSKICQDDFTGWKYCCEYTTYYQWMYVDWYLVLNLADQRDIEREVNECLNEAAIVSLIAAIIAAWLGGGGSALESAKAAFVAALIECLKRKITDLNLIAAWVETSSHWGDWETS